MKKLLPISLMLTSACSSYGNDPASQFAGVQYDANYYKRMEIMQAEACELRETYCSPYVRGAF